MWRNRAVLGARLLRRMPELSAVTSIVKHHLEYWDGSGYPDGMKGETIALESRIIGLVSYFQELTQSRGDRIALGPTDAFKQCQKHSGSRFEPKLVETLGNIVRLAELGLMELPSQPGQLPNRLG